MGLCHSSSTSSPAALALREDEDDEHSPKIKQASKNPKEEEEESRSYLDADDDAPPPLQYDDAPRDSFSITSNSNSLWSWSLQSKDATDSSAHWSRASSAKDDGRRVPSHSSSRSLNDQALYVSFHPPATRILSQNSPDDDDERSYNADEGYIWA